MHFLFKNLTSGIKYILQNIITFIAPYSLVVSLLYLFGFWGVFNINILEYIALTDVIKNALYPLLYSSVFIVLGLAISNLVTVPLSKKFPSGEGKDLPEAKFIRWLIVISVLYLSGLALYTIFFQVGNARWLEVALIVSPIVTISVVVSDFASGYIKNRHLRSFIVVSLSLTLLCSYGWGATNAERAKKKRSNY